MSNDDINKIIQSIYKSNEKNAVLFEGLKKDIEYIRNQVTMNGESQKEQERRIDKLEKWQEKNINIGADVKNLMNWKIFLTGMWALASFLIGLISWDWVAAKLDSTDHENVFKEELILEITNRLNLE